MEIAEIVLAYLTVLFSAAPVAGFVILCAVFVFRSQLEDLIGRIGRIKLPGGGELTTLQQVRTAADEKGKLPDVPDESDVGVPEGVALSGDDLNRVVQAIKHERANAYLWEYRYLNLYLVRSTQTVLDWLAGLTPPISAGLVDNQLQTWISDANERTAILGALANHHLIQVQGGLIDVTPKGREYLEWRGPLPPLPQNTP